MAGFDLEQWVDYLGLIRVQDPTSEKPVYRRSPNGEIVQLKQLDALLALRLRELRTERQLSQAKVAKLLGVKETSYARYENGKSQITVGRLLHIFEVLDVTSDQFFGPFLKEATAERNKLMHNTIEHLYKLDPHALRMVHDLVTKMDPLTIGRGKGNGAAQAAP